MKVYEVDNQDDTLRVSLQQVHIQEMKESHE
jgi:hypothetical protein